MIWGDYKLKKNHELDLSIKDVLDLHIARKEQEVWISYERLSSIFSDTGSAPEVHTEAASEAQQQTHLHADSITEEMQDEIIHDLPERDWSRWALRSKNPELSLKPVFPDLSFIVRPDYPFRLAPGAEAKIYTRIPLAIGIYDKTDGMIKLCEINTVDMVQSWFGTFENGELCYWLKTTASQIVRNEMFRAHRCYCPVHIKNNSSEFLHVEKLCLRVDRLSIFEQQKKLWSDEMKIVHEGGDNFSDLIVSGQPPAEASNARLISGPRNPVKKGIAERTFRLLHMPSLKF